MLSKFLLRSHVLVIALIFIAAIVAHGKVNRNYGFHSSGNQAADEFYGLEFSQLDGGKFGFENLRGKVVFITNVASECGYTDVNYAQLKQLSEEFGEDLAIVLVPSNDFGKQEPGDAPEIIKFIQNRGGSNYIVLAKSATNGPNQHPLFKTLKVSFHILLRLFTSANHVCHRP